MKRLLTFFGLLWVIGGLMAAEVNKKFFPYKYEKYTLSNGLSAILIPMEGTGLVAYYSVVRTGSRDEWEPGHTGFAHFFEHMMFRGTRKYPSEVYDRIVTEMGANANAYTTDDYTCYFLVFSRENLKKVMDLESDRFQNLSYDELAFKTEAGAVYGEYRKNRVSPWAVLFENLYDTAFERHTYKHTTIGFEEDIKNMPHMFKYSLSFFKRYYRPENVVLLIVGDFDLKKVKEGIEKYYGHWGRGYVSPEVQPEPEQQRERVKEVKYLGKTLPILALGYKSDAFDPDSKRVAGGFLLADLAFGENSNIYKKLVIREQKVRFISSDYSLTRDPKLFLIYTMVKNEEDIPYIQAEIDKVTVKYKNELVEHQLLENLKERICYKFLMSLDTPDNVAGNLARMVALTGGIEAVDQFYTTIQSVTPEDIQRVAQKYFNKDHRTVIILKGEK